MTLTRKTFLNMAGAAALAFGFNAAPVAAQEVTLSLHQFLPPQANVPKLVLDVWAKNVMEASDGRIKIDSYPSMQLGGKPPELMDQAIDGVSFPGAFGTDLYEQMADKTELQRSRTAADLGYKQ